jgi:peptidoglycan/LPS O-acetylase OafA/YrhL
MRLSPRIEFANRLRGLAALSVVLYHYSMFWVFGWPPRIWANLPDTAASADLPMTWMYQFPVRQRRDWIPTIDWGAFGVALFFLISGFVIANSVKRYSPREFLINRLLRIYPTYAVGFACVVGVLALSGALYGRGFPYSTSQVLAHMLPGIRQALGSVYIDPVIWTLETEIKFYAVVFLALMFVDRQSFPAMRIAVTLGVCGVIAAWLRPAFLVSSPGLRQLLSDLQFVVFIFIGAIFFELWCKDISPQQASLKIITLGAIFSLIWLLSWRGEPIAGQSIGRIWSYAAAVAVFKIAMDQSDWFENQNTIADFFARISYPLYVVHLAPGYLIMTLLRSTALWPPVIIALTLAAVCVLAVVLHVAVELPTQRFARRLAAPTKKLQPLLGDSPASPAE